MSREGRGKPVAEAEATKKPLAALSKDETYTLVSCGHKEQAGEKNFHYLAKPIDAERLFFMLRVWLSRD